MGNLYNARKDIEEMKKLITLLLIISLALTLTACNGNIENGNSPNQTNDPENPNLSGTQQDEPPQDGWGVWIYHNYRYEGYFKNGMPNGEGTLYIAMKHREPETLQEGQTYAVTTTIQGNWIDGYADGEIHYNWVLNNGNSYTWRFNVVMGRVTSEVYVLALENNLTDLTVSTDSLFGVPPWVDVWTDPSLPPPDGNNEFPTTPDTDTTQIDTPVDPNQLGNTVSNLANGSFAIIQSDWIYYRGEDNGIYKIRTDGTKQTQISELRHDYPIQVVGDWIYFVGSSEGGVYEGLHRIRTNGNDIMPIYTYSDDDYSRDMFIQRFYVVGEWVYFIMLEPQSGFEILYKIRTDGTNETLMIDGEYDSFSISDGWIYFKHYNTRYRMKLDGSEREQLQPLPQIKSNSQIIGDWIYYVVLDDSWNYAGLARVRIDGTEEMTITTNRVGEFNVVGDWIYYSNISDNRALYKIRTDGTGNIKLDDTILYGAINIVGDWIYVQKTASGINIPQPPILHRIRTDGTDFQVVN